MRPSLECLEMADRMRKSWIFSSMLSVLRASWREREGERGREREGGRERERLVIDIRAHNTNVPQPQYSIIFNLSLFPWVCLAVSLNALGQVEPITVKLYID